MKPPVFSWQPDKNLDLLHLEKLSDFVLEQPPALPVTPEQGPFKMCEQRLQLFSIQDLVVASYYFRQLRSIPVDRRVIMPGT